MKQFELVEAPRVKRAAFDLSHERKTTFNMGYLVPVLCEETLPGDRFKIDFEAFMRTMPLVSPVMHRVNLYAHCFFVPMRLLYKDQVWEKFITQTAGAIAALPSFSENIFQGALHATNGDLFDHLGYGYKAGSGNANPKMSQGPARAYHKIYNDYYRNQNFIAEYDVTALPDAFGQVEYNLDQTINTLRKRAWEKDYFTASLPTQQRGAQVMLPITQGQAPVRGKDFRTTVANDAPLFKIAVTGATPVTGPPQLNNANGGYMQDNSGSRVSITSGLEADLSGITAGSITQFRQALALQRWYEASMRFGQRYAEQILGIFGQKYSDARLQRAEFLCGGTVPVQIGEVLQTSATVAGQTPQGNLAGKGMSSGHLFHCDRTFEEHGYVMIIVSAMPRTSYATASRRRNFKLTTFDFAFPQLAHISEQPTYKAEIFMDGYTDAIGRQAFGYQPMYEEYRFVPDSVHGDFRGTLGYWSLARDFAGAPALNTAFIEANPRTDIFPVAFANQQLILQSFAKITAIRPLPKFGTPL